MTAAFEALNPASWTTTDGVPVSFPYSSVHTTFTHDLAKHKYYGVDGVSIEATGRNERVVRLTIPFFNGIQASRKESWDPRQLYPKIYHDFITATANRATGTLVHPEFGQIYCKVEHVDAELTAQQRGGALVTCVFVETREPGELDDFDSGYADLASARDLDAHKDDIRNLITDWNAAHAIRGNYFLTALATFEDDLSVVKSYGDQAFLAQEQVRGKINSVTSKLAAVVDSFDRAVSTSAYRTLAADNEARVNRVLSWGLLKSAERLAIRMDDASKAIMRGQREILELVTPAATTLAGMLVATRCTINELVTLNPEVSRLAVIPMHTKIRYFAKATK